MTRSVRLTLEDVRFAYQDEAPAMRFSATIDPGAICAVMGPSGSGKSTLLSLIAGFETPQAGQILVDTVDILRLEPAGRPVTMVFQDNNLFAHLSVLQNVALGIRPNGRLDGPEHASALQALERVGLADFAERRPAALSGGERQRVALARALLRRKPILLLDEPFAALGPKLRADMQAIVVQLAREEGMTTLVISHDPREAEQMADSILFIDNGTIAAHGSLAQMFERKDLTAWNAYLGR